MGLCVGKKGSEPGEEKCMQIEFGTTSQNSLISFNATPCTFFTATSGEGNTDWEKDKASHRHSGEHEKLSLAAVCVSS
jgi:hypothetical protein